MSDTLEFTTRPELDAFLSGLGYARLPVQGQPTYAADGFDDAGRPIVTFARVARYTPAGAPIRVTLTEMVRR
jgi:hypothetical protein